MVQSIQANRSRFSETEIREHDLTFPVVTIGDCFLRDDCAFYVNEILPHRDPYITAEIRMRGPRGSVCVGYWDLRYHKREPE